MRCASGAAGSYEGGYQHLERFGGFPTALNAAAAMRQALADFNAV
jgi:hypothetical protein